MTAPDTHTERRAGQRELEQMNRLYTMLSRINRAIVRTESPVELYAEICRIATECGGFALAWFSLLEPGSQRAVPVAAEGVGTVADLRSIEALTDGRCPTSQAVRDESPFVVNDTLGPPPSAPWRGLTGRFGIRAGGSFPVRLGDRIIGALNVGATEPGIFHDAELQLLTEAAGDLSFALTNLHRQEQHSATESRMRYLAYYDSQTGLPSRALFEEQLAQACQEQPDRITAVLVVNLRQYHGITQLHGPSASQELIRMLAARFETALPALPVARISESEFAVMLSDPAGLDVAEELAWKINRALAQGVRVGEHELFLDPFVGIAAFPQDGTPAELLQHAMTAAATTQATLSGCRFYFPELDDRSRRRLHLDSALRRALERGEFTLHYQPQVDLHSGRVVGAEALLRWLRPGHGPISPMEFIPLLEESGLINPVGEWVLHEACRSARQWLDEGLPPFRIAVNLSARQYHDADIRSVVRRTLDVTGLAPERLELELTEGIVLLNAERAIRTMSELNAIGVSHALDDFGTGYSSLSYLQRLPVARIKIDRAFVTHITSRPGDGAIARAVVSMAHSLGLAVIAEGVETEGQLGFLRGIGCEEIQGYYFSRPLPGDEFAALLREGRGIPPEDEALERVLLLVDDEPGILAALTRTLRRDGYRIVTATNAAEGFELLASHHPGVVVCDQRMPSMTGTEFLRRVKQLYPDTVRVVLSGHTELGSVIDAVNQGAIYKFLGKPWEDTALRESIKDAFRIFELGRENQKLSRLLEERSAPQA